MFASALALLLPIQDPAPAVALPDRITVHGELYGRAELRDDGELRTATGESTDDARLRGTVAFTYRHNPYLAGFAEALVTWGDEGDTTTEDLHQIYLDLHRFLGDWDLRLGRTELDFGDGRFLSANRAWLFQPSAFDGLLVSGDATSPSFRWSAWVTRAATGLLEESDDDFAGFHAEWGISARTDAEFFLTHRRQPGNDLEELSAAMRWHGRTVHGLEWSAFGAAQGGDAAGGQEVWAQAGALALGKELDNGHRIGCDLSIAKGGDSDPEDFKRYTPFGMDQHAFNGRADLFAFANLVDVSLNYGLPLGARWSLHADLHQFWRQNEQDDAYAAYTLQPYGINGGSRSLGTELDLYASAQLGPTLRCETGVAYFFNSGNLPSEEDQVWIFAGGALSF